AHRDRLDIEAGPARGRAGGAADRRRGEVDAREVVVTLEIHQRLLVGAGDNHVGERDVAGRIRDHVIEVAESRDVDAVIGRRRAGAGGAGDVYIGQRRVAGELEEQEV